MKCHTCRRTAEELDKLEIVYLFGGYGELYCFPCFTCSKCHRHGTEVDGNAKLLQTTPILCTECEKCPCGSDVNRWVYEGRNDKKIYYCDPDCQDFYIMRSRFFLFVFALKEKGLQREFRCLLPMIFRAVQKMPDRRCVDCWQECYRNVCVRACGGTQCFAIREQACHAGQDAILLGYRLYAPFMCTEQPCSPRFSLSELPTKGTIRICKSCELRRHVPKCVTSQKLQIRIADERQRQLNIRRTEYVRRSTNKVRVTRRTPMVPKQKMPKNTKNPKGFGYVPNQKKGKIGNFKKNKR